MGWETILEIIGKLAVIGLSLAENLGQRDAFLVALDSTLAVVRKKTDDDLTAKHRHDR